MTTTTLFLTHDKLCHTYFGPGDDVIMTNVKY